MLDGGAGVGVGKVMLCAVVAPGVEIISTGAGVAPGEVGLAVGWERERIVPPGRVMAEEPGRRVRAGSPVEGL